jgi:ankyrin repeat protein
MDYRHQDVEKAFPGTNTWIFQNKSYQRWIYEERRLLWIKGKPGSGKSTIIKRILDSFTREPAANQIQLYFFFHRRGSQLQYTQVGMLRTLLHQLIRQATLVRTMFETAWVEKKRVQDGEVHAKNWRLEELRDLFSTLLVAAAEKQKITIFVDALDEAGEDAGKDLLYYFHRLSNDISETQARVSICFSCRRYPVFVDHDGLDVWIDQENQEDIATYTVAELDRQLVKDADHQTAVESLQVNLIRKSSGVFLWVALMLPIVTKEYNDGEPLHSILRRLNEVPSDLSQIYEYILTNVVNAEKRSRTLRFMQCIFLAQEPIEAIAVIHALACDDISVRRSPFPVNDLVSPGNDSQVEKLVLSLSGGLAEVKYGSDFGKNHVQFIHESVNDFWRKDNFRCLGFTPKSDAVGESHYDLCVFCLDYSKLAFEMVPYDKDRSIPSTRAENAQRRSAMPVHGVLRDEIENRFPFIHYATTSWLSHAKRAERRGISLAGLLRQLNCPPSDFFERMLGHLSTYISRSDNLVKGATLLHLAASFGLESLMRELLETGAEVNHADCEGSTALAFAPTDSMQILLDYGADINAPLSQYRDSPLSAAAWLGDEEVVRFLVEHGADVNAFVPGLGSHTNFSPLEAAVQSIGENAVPIARFLLDNGADIRPRMQTAERHGLTCRYTLLDTALHDGIPLVEGHNDEIVQLLLERGAYVNLPPKRKQSLLQEAVQVEEPGLVRLFLAHGAHVNVDATDISDTALGLAARLSGHALMRTLLEAGADVFRQTRWYGPLYQIAKRSVCDSEAKVRLLLEFGYGRRWAIRSGISLAKTAKQGSETMLRLLLLAKVDKARDGYTVLLQLAKGSDVEREGKVKLLLKYKYGARWLNSDWASAASSFRRIEDLSEESDG